MSKNNSQSNEHPSFFWSFKAKLKNGDVIDCANTPWQFLNKPAIKPLIELIGLFYKGEYRGSIEYRDETQRPILIHRHQEIREYGTNIRVKSIHFWIIGWQSTIGGKNTKSILFLYDNGEIVLRNHDGRIK